MTELQSEEINEIMPALIKASQAFSPAVKNATNPAFRSKYVDLEGALEAVTPSLLANGIVLMQQTDYTDSNEILLLTRLIHSSGQWLGSRYPVKPVKQDPQGEGSALTYARRYTAMAICGIAPEDDDGNAASPRDTQQARTTPPARQPRPAAPASPGALESVGKYKGMIAAAQNADDLNKVGTELAAANVSSSDKAGLRAEFSARMAVLQAR